MSNFKHILNIFKYIENVICKLQLALHKQTQKAIFYENNTIRSTHQALDMQTIESVKKNESTKDLSFIVPVYNSKEYIAECLESLVNQKTEYIYEMILVNDGSTDGTAKMLESYSKNEKIKIIHQQNGGISRARNKGLEVAKGKYIAFVDNDDYVSKDYVQMLLDTAVQHDADMVKCGYVMFNQNGVIRRFTLPKRIYKSPLGDKVCDFNGLIWGGIIKRKIFKEICFPADYWYEDMITKVVVMQLCQSFVSIDDTLYFNRQHRNNATKKLWNSYNMKSLDQFYLLRELIKLDIELGIDINLMKKVILNELGPMLYYRTKNLPLINRQDVFYNSCALISDIYGEAKLCFEDNNYDILANAFYKRDFKLWKIVTRIMCNQK